MQVCRHSLLQTLWTFCSEAPHCRSRSARLFENLSTRCSRVKIYHFQGTRDTAQGSDQSSPMLNRPSINPEQLHYPFKITYNIIRSCKASPQVARDPLKELTSSSSSLRLLLWKHRFAVSSPDLYPWAWASTSHSSGMGCSTSCWAA